MVLDITLLNDAQYNLWKWQLTGIGYSTAAQASGAHCPRNGLWTRSYAARRTTSQTATLGLHPVIRVPILHGVLLNYQSLRDGWLGWPCWLTYSGRLNHKVVTHPTSSLALWRRIGKVRRLRPAF